MFGSGLWVREQCEHMFGVWSCLRSHYCILTEIICSQYMVFRYFKAQFMFDHGCTFFITLILCLYDSVYCKHIRPVTDLFKICHHHIFLRHNKPPLRPGLFFSFPSLAFSNSSRVCVYICWQIRMLPLIRKAILERRNVTSLTLTLKVGRSLPSCHNLWFMMEVLGLRQRQKDLSLFVIFKQIRLSLITIWSLWGQFWASTWWSEDILARPPFQWAVRGLIVYG